VEGFELDTYSTGLCRPCTQQTRLLRTRQGPCERTSWCLIGMKLFRDQVGAKMLDDSPGKTLAREDICTVAYCLIMAPSPT
jgi:hypothetical protein